MATVPIAKLAARNSINLAPETVGIAATADNNFENIVDSSSLTSSCPSISDNSIIRKIVITVTAAASNTITFPTGDRRLTTFLKIQTISCNLHSSHRYHHHLLLLSSKTAAAVDHYY